MADLHPLPRLARMLGYAGLLPQLGAFAVLASGRVEHRELAQLLAITYAALIFGFLGALWWGLAAAQPTRAPAWIWWAGVLPSLISLFLFLRWASGHLETPAALLSLAFGIAGSSLVDQYVDKLKLCPPGWANFRLALSIGLGSITLACAIA